MRLQLGAVKPRSWQTSQASFAQCNEKQDQGLKAGVGACVCLNHVCEPGGFCWINIISVQLHAGRDMPVNKLLINAHMTLWARPRRWSLLHAKKLLNGFSAILLSNFPENNSWILMKKIWHIEGSRMLGLDRDMYVLYWIQGLGQGGGGG